MAINITSISNVVLEPFFEEELKKIIPEPINYHFIFDTELFNNNMIDILGSSEFIIVILDFESKYKNDFDSFSNSIVDTIVKDTLFIYDYIEKNTNGKIIWTSYETYQNNIKYVLGNTYRISWIPNRVNDILCNHIKNKDILIDFSRIISEIGMSESFSITNKYRWNSIYSKRLIQALCYEIKKQYDIERFNTPKCIVLDCDNVLWGGTILEDGIENLKLSRSGTGRFFYDFQVFLLQLYKLGIIITICSKNDYNDVIHVFHENDAMVIKEENISLFRVNWDNKYNNIMIISEMLRISLKDMVFIDDSINEIEEVKFYLPEINCIQFDKKNIFRNLSIFNIKNGNKNDIQKRMDTYRTDSLRNDLKNQSKNYEDYLKTLDTIIDIHLAKNEELLRISELSFRTNKCTIGMRASIDKLKELKLCGKLFSVFVKDRFSDLGLVGCIGIENNKLVLFSLSCRALGRRIEEQMMAFINKNYDINSIQYVSTGKNKWFYDFLKDTINKKSFYHEDKKV